MPKRIKRKSPKVKRQFKPPKFMRVALMVVAVAVGVYLAMLVVAKVTKPYRISYGESKEIASIQKQIADAKTDNEQLKRDLAFLATPQGKEAEARRLGWVKKGETALVVQQPDQSKFKLDQAEAMRETFWQSAGKKLIKMFVKTGSK